MQNEKLKMKNWGTAREDARPTFFEEEDDPPSLRFGAARDEED
jgi:hypothetical protein